MLDAVPPVSVRSRSLSLLPVCRLGDEREHEHDDRGQLDEEEGWRLM